MASTYSTDLKIELIGTGDQSGTWGTTTNTNLGTLIEQAIVGYVTQAVTDGAATVLTIPNGTSSNGRNYVIELTGALTANRTVEVPAVDKPYIFFNNTTGGFSVTVKVSGQTGVTIANGKKAIVYTNSTDVIEVVNAPVSEAGTQTLTNKTLTNPTINGFTGNTAVVNIGSGQIYKDTSGNVGIGTASPGQKLDVNGSLNVGPTIFTGTGVSTGDVAIELGGNRTGSGNSYLDFHSVASTDYDFRILRNSGTNGGVQFLNTGVGDFQLAQTGAGPITFLTSNSERARIDSSGNVGIGTSSPSASLSVVKQTTALSGTGNSYGLYMYPTSSGLAYIDAITGSTGNSSLGLRTYNNGTYNEVRIDANGYVGIGTNSPSAMLHVTGSSAIAALKVPNILEVSTVSATAATGTINYDAATQSVLYYTSNATANWTLNIRASSGTSLNTFMAVNDTLTIVHLVTQGATAYYNNALTIDGSSVTPKYQGGTAWSAGNASGIDVYTYTIIKTASATFTVLASQTQFK